MKKIINSISIIVFSKDRPLQLDGYLRSLLYFSDLDEKQITVLYKDSNEILYENLFGDYQFVNWIKEDKFMNNLTTVINNSSEYIMFGCDDVIFKDFIDINYALNTMFDRKDLFGFSLRLGRNIKPSPKNIVVEPSHITWNWKANNLSSWNYPWELDSTIYRKEDVLDILSQLDEKKIKNPNFFESEIAGNLSNYIKLYKMAAFHKSKSIVVTVNRVQETFKNEFDDSLATDVHSLYRIYLTGAKMDYLKISEKSNKHIHVGAEYFKLTGTTNYQLNLIMRFQFYCKKLRNFLKRSI
ncbi:MAG TPA: hypothetical protein VK541_00160 [Pedobacter sp.]|uniref:hypothetical protein n=1 Tax=Pedobacter sp. TaxID=1411316 RepID=UPI002B8344DB|nr:hypothetical protein [Pedobacter sp.]HMI00856.1 hypothetical protein [Pedobacter sp.]